MPIFISFHTPIMFRFYFKVPMIWTPYHMQYYLPIISLCWIEKWQHSNQLYMCWFYWWQHIYLYLKVRTFCYWCNKLQPFNIIRYLCRYKIIDKGYYVPVYAGAQRIPIYTVSKILITGLLTMWYTRWPEIVQHGGKCHT